MGEIYTYRDIYTYLKRQQKGKEKKKRREKKKDMKNLIKVSAEYSPLRFFPGRSGQHKKLGGKEGDLYAVYAGNKVSAKITRNTRPLYLVPSVQNGSGGDTSDIYAVADHTDYQSALVAKLLRDHFRDYPYIARAWEYQGNASGPVVSCVGPFMSARRAIEEAWEGKIDATANSQESRRYVTSPTFQQAETDVSTLTRELLGPEKQETLSQLRVVDGDSLETKNGSTFIKPGSETAAYLIYTHQSFLVVKVKKSENAATIEATEGLRLRFVAKKATEYVSKEEETAFATETVTGEDAADHAVYASWANYLENLYNETYPSLVDDEPNGLNVSTDSHSGLSLQKRIYADTLMLLGRRLRSVMATKIRRVLQTMSAALQTYYFNTSSNTDVCWCGFSRRACPGGDKGRTWTVPVDIVPEYQQMCILFRSANDFPAPLTDIHQTVLSAYNTNDEKSRENNELYKALGTRCPGPLDTTMDKIVVMHEKVQANSTAMVDIPIVAFPVAALDLDKQWPIAPGEVPRGYIWPKESDPLIQNLLERFLSGDLKYHDSYPPSVLSWVSDTTKMLQDGRAFMLERTLSFLPPEASLGDQLDAVTASLVRYPPDSTRLFSGYAHDDTKWPGVAAHKDVDRLRTIYDNLGLLIDLAQDISYVRAVVPRMRRLKASLVTTSSSPVPAQTSPSFPEFLLAYASCLQPAYVDHCRGSDAKDQCLYREPGHELGLVSLTGFTFSHLQKVMPKALAMIRNGPGTTLAMVDCLIERYFRPGAEEDSRQHVVVLPAKDLFASFCRVLEEQLRHRKKYMNVSTLSYVTIKNELAFGIAGDTDSLNSAKQTTEVLPRGSSVQDSAQGRRSVPVLLLSLGDLRMLLKIHVPNQFDRLGITEYSRHGNSANFGTKGTYVYFNEIHAVFTKGHDDLSRLELQCGGVDEAKGPKFADRELSSIRYFLKKSAQTACFSGTPYDISIPIGDPSGMSPPNYTLEQEINKYNDLFSLPEVGSYLLVGLYTPVDNLSAMNLRLHATELKEIALQGRHYLRSSVLEKARASVERGDVELNKLIQTYVKKDGNRPYIDIDNGCEYLLHWLRKNVPDENGVLANTLLLESENISARYKYGFGSVSGLALTLRQDNDKRAKYYQHVWQKLDIKALSSVPSRVVIMFTEATIGYELMACCFLARVPFVCIDKQDGPGRNIEYGGEIDSPVVPITSTADVPAYLTGLRRFNETRSNTGAYVLFYNTSGLKHGLDIGRVNRLVVLSIYQNPITILHCMLRVNRFGKIAKTGDGQPLPVEIEFFPGPYGQAEFCSMIYRLQYYSAMVRKYPKLAPISDTMFTVHSGTICPDTSHPVGL